MVELARSVARIDIITGLAQAVDPTTRAFIYVKQ